MQDSWTMRPFPCTQWAPHTVPPPFLCRRPLLHWIKCLGSENWSRMSGIPQTKGSYFLRYKDPYCTQQAQILCRVKEKWRGSLKPTSFSRGNWITLEFADWRESLERTEVIQRKDRRWMHFLCANAGKDSLSDVTPDIKMSAPDTEHLELCVVPFAVGMLSFIKAGPHWKTFKILTDVENVIDHTHMDMKGTFLGFSLGFPTRILEHVLNVRFSTECDRKQL